MRVPQRASLEQYLRNCLILLGVIIAIIYGYGMSAIYSWALDDASEFYLFRDAKSVELLVQQNLPLPVNTESEKYFLGYDSLPVRYQNIVAETSTISPDVSPAMSSAMSPELFHLEREGQFDYLLAYPLEKTSAGMDHRVLYVIHSFDLQEDASISGLSAIELSTLIFGVALVLILLMASYIYRSIIEPVSTLYQWGNSMGNKYQEPHIFDLPTDALRFSELQSVGEKLHNALQHVVARSEREKSFVRCLSHELRTPMAVTRAAIELLDKRELDGYLTKKIAKIREANMKMIAISDTLLNIWLDQGKNGELQQVAVFELIEGILHENNTIVGRTDVHVKNCIDPELVVLVFKQPFLIIASNLVKNALQYTHAGCIHIEFQNGTLSVKNPVANDGVSDGAFNQQASSADYGYGLGFFIAETVANQYSWSLRYHQEDGVFFAILTIP